jgi:hypothetical protein
MHITLCRCLPFSLIELLQSLKQTVIQLVNARNPFRKHTLFNAYQLTCLSKMHLDGKFSSMRVGKQKEQFNKSFSQKRRKKFFGEKLNKSQSLLSTQSTWILGRGCV